MPRVLQICDGECAEPLVICGCAPFSQKTVQNSGRAFFDRFEKSDSDSDAESRPEARPEGGGKDASPSREGKKKEKKKAGDEALKLPECLKGEDLYALLDVDSGAGAEDLKKAYRKVCLTHHPDKHGDKTGPELEAINLEFVKLQECFNILSDVKKRRKYDSTGEFDDRVPKQIKEDQDFFEVCCPVFKKESKWSERKPVPELGDANTPYEKVKSFYEFWFAFESWRDLDSLIMEENGEDCFKDTEDAECRDEKRWMEKENAKMRKNYEKAERTRVFSFVELAEKNDPRVIAEKEKQWAVKEAAKIAKEAKRVEAERIRAEEEAARAAAEEEAKAARAIEKAQREEEKQAAKKARAKLRKSVQGLNLGFAEDPLQEFLLMLDPQETDELTKKLASGVGGKAVLEAMKAKGVEPIYSMQDEKSTEEGSASEAEPTPEEKAKQLRDQKKRQQDLERKQKKVDAEQLIIREKEAAARAVEKAARDVVKKAEQEKKDREIQRSNKKEAEKLKKDQEKKEKEAEKLVAKAKAEKDANKQRAEEQRQDQLLEKQELLEENALELRTAQFERDRLACCDAYDKLDAAGVIEAVQAAVAHPVVASGLAAAAASCDPISEDLLDAQLACLGSFFALAKRPEDDALALSSALRSRVKKLRAKLRASALTFVLEPAAGTKADPAALELMIAAANGEAVHPVDAEAAAAAPVEVAPATAKSKKKSKAKAAPAEEDFDALLKEFDMGDGEKKSKKGGKKK